ncbi:lipoprotein-releasing ABC transporter permease subunit LolC [Candidatus Gillettellia adelgis]
MYRPVALFISLRYICGRTSNRFGRFVFWSSTMGVMLGVMALILVLSVINGFDKDLEKNVLGLMPQALITSKKGSINPTMLPASAIKNLQGVYRVSPLTTANVVLQSAQGIALGVMLGINQNETDPLTPYLGDIQQQLQPNHYNIIVGEQLANQLNVKPGDSLRLLVPSTYQLTPMGRIPSQRLFTLIGTFHANSEVDSYQCLLNQEDASRLMRYTIGNITGWRLFLKHPIMVNTVSHQKIPKGTEWRDWRERKSDLFQAVQMEKNIMTLLLSLLVTIAISNIVTFLALLIMEKESEIAILQTVGLARYQIMAIFVIQGTSAGIIGSLIGALLGILSAKHLNNLMPVLTKFINGHTLPVLINPLQAIIIAAVAMTVSFIATLYPSWRATSSRPAEVLCYE